MSRQRAEEEESKKGLRPSIKMLAELKIDGNATEQFLQVPGVIAYREKMQDNGVECAIDCNNQLVFDLISSMIGETSLEIADVRRMQFPKAYQNTPHQSVIFPVEKHRESVRFSFAVNDFYGVYLKRDYLWTRDSYASVMGWHIRRLSENRRQEDRSGGVFLAMNFSNETPKAKASSSLWKDIVRWLDKINQPITAPRRFLCGDAKPCAAMYAYIPLEDTIMHWACMMANCRLYIGPDCLLSQLAYSLRVPAIVLSELPRHSYIDRHDVGKYADPLHQYCYQLNEVSQWSLDNVIARYNELERILLTEY